MPRLLLTRPQAASERLAVKLAEWGYDCLIEPLLTIQPVPSPWPGPETFDAIMITSANALDALTRLVLDFGPLPDELYRLPCYCVGLRTAECATASGFQKTHHDETGDGDGIALAGQLLQTSARRILHIAGADVASAGAECLLQAGRQVINWTVYKAEPAKTLSPDIVTELKQGRLAGTLVFSARTAATLIELIHRARLEACCPALIALGLSEAVTQILTPLPWRRLVAAAYPSEAAMLDLVKEVLPSGT